MITMNQNSFDQRIREEKPVLVEFWAPWCSYCRRIAPAVARIDREWQEQLTLAQVNIDEVPALAEQEGIELVPTLVLYRGGQALDAIVAPECRTQIEDFLRETLPGN